MSQKAPPSPPAPSRGATALLVLGLAESLLSVFQWSQLLKLQAGGTTVCSISEHVNCEAVWTTPFATRLHEVLGVPVAGLGLLWGVVATALAGLYLTWNGSGQNVRPAANGLRLVAAVGVLATVVFGGVSASAGVLCLTCLATYILVLAFAGVAWRGLPGPVLPQSGEWRRTLPWPVGFALVGFIAVSIPGWATPKPSYSPAPMPEASSVGEGSLEAYLRSLAPRDQRFIAEALAEYRRQTPMPVKAPARFREGPVDAPVKIVEWTDPLCPHCRMLVKAMGEMKKHVPEGMMSIEARHFPLDGGCNPNISPERTDGGLRCLAAKATICLEGAPDFWEMREKLFDAQTVLTLNNVLDIAGSGKSVNRAQLEACVNSPDTARKLQEDIDYVAQYRPDGTPFVVVNGREAVPGVPFLYALVLAGGDVNHPAFRMLPPVDISAASSP